MGRAGKARAGLGKLGPGFCSNDSRSESWTRI